ncbi:MAG: helicase-associated domain-containing protein [Pseudonocardia sp.]
MGTADDDASTVRSTELEALANVATVLQLCAAGKLRCSEKTSRPSAATVRVVAESLAAGDFYTDDAIASFAWPLLLQAGGLARLEGGKLALTPKGSKALGLPPAEVIRGLWERWPRHAPIDEFSRVEQIKGQRSSAALSATGPRRQVAAAALALCPPDGWIAVDELFSQMRDADLNPTIARSERGLWRLYIDDAQYGSLGYDGHHDWPILEGRYTLAVLFEYAATLGLLDVEYVDPVGARDDYCHMWGADWIEALSRYDGLRAVRLNGLGQYAVGLNGSYAPPASAPSSRGLEVLANFDVVATAELPTADRLVLDAYAARTSDRVWTLSAASLLAAVDRGRTPANLLTFLAERAAHELPDTVATLLGDVADRAGQVRDLGMRRIVECAYPHVATLIAHDRALRAHCTLIGDRHLMLSDSNEARFRSALRGLGYALGPASAG